MNNKNLVSLDLIKNIARNKKLQFKDIIYSPRKYKKYRTILNDGSFVDWGDIRYQDKLIHEDPKRVENFKKRFYNLYQKNKNNPNSAIYWTYQVNW